MSKADITKFFADNAKGLFLAESAVYLGLSHGDTTSHPYVPATCESEPVRPVQKPSYVSASRPTVSPTSWRHQWETKRGGPNYAPKLVG